MTIADASVRSRVYQHVSLLACRGGEPSAGLSSGILIAKALEQRQVPSGAVNSSVLIYVVSWLLRKQPSCCTMRRREHARGVQFRDSLFEAITSFSFDSVLVEVGAVRGRRPPKSTPGQVLVLQHVILECQVGVEPFQFRVLRLEHFQARLFFLPTLLAMPPHSARTFLLPRVYIFGRTT